MFHLKVPECWHITYSKTVHFSALLKRAFYCYYSNIIKHYPTLTETKSTHVTKRYAHVQVKLMNQIGKKKAEIFFIS